MSISGTQQAVRAEYIKNINRVVVKFGTGVLTGPDKKLDLGQVSQLVEQIARQCKLGKELVIVTSGAVGAGMGLLGLEKRPTELSELQACAAVGQTRLMAIYEEFFSKYGIHIGQILLTHDDVEHHERHLNARNTLVTLLERGVVPIINENDVVSTTELKFGDNDRLSALVASLLPADLLIILTTVEGLYDNYGKEDQRIITKVEKIDSLIEKTAKGTDSETAVGGMRTKIQAAKIAVKSGIPMVIACGRRPDVIAEILEGKEVGTLFVPSQKKLRSRKRWIAFFHHPKGAIFVDDGAKVALREKNKSLLPPGIIRCDGEFEPGDVVRICDKDGTEFARGIVKFSSEQIRSGQRPRDEVVHRDDLVIL